MLSPYVMAQIAGGVGAMLGAADFSSTIGLGSVLVGILIVIGLGYFRWRQGIGETWQGEAAAQKERGDRLETENKALVGANHDLEKRLLARVDFASLTESMQSAAQIHAEAARGNEERITLALSALTHEMRALTTAIGEQLREHYKLLGAYISSAEGVERQRDALTRLDRRHKPGDEEP